LKSIFCKNYFKNRSPSSIYKPTKDSIATLLIFLILVFGTLIDSRFPLAKEFDHLMECTIIYKENYTGGASSLEYNLSQSRSSNQLFAFKLA
jgi:hypothetical protein